jgi:hypothetical protein
MKFSGKNRHLRQALPVMDIPGETEPLNPGQTEPVIPGQTGSSSILVKFLIWF